MGWLGITPDKATGGSVTLPGVITTFIGLAVKLCATLWHWDDALVDAVTSFIIAGGVLVMVIGFRRLGGDIKNAVQTKDRDKEAK